MLFTVNGVSIDSLEMDYKRRVILSSSLKSPEFLPVLGLFIFKKRSVTKT